MKEVYTHLFELKTINAANLSLIVLKHVDVLSKMVTNACYMEETSISSSAILEASSQLLKAVQQESARAESEIRFYLSDVLDKDRG